MTPPHERAPHPRTLVMRRAGSEDLPVLRRIKLDAYDIYEPLLGFQALPVTTDYTPYVAAGGVWLGVLDAEAIAALVTELGTDHLLIFSVAVLPDHQGEGHARTLLDHAEREARAVGRRELRLFTNALMERNLALYRHCGFREQGRRPHPSQTGHEVVDMVRALA